MYTILLIFVSVLYSLIAAAIFFEDMQREAIGEAFGWPGAPVWSSAVKAILWPLLLPFWVFFYFWEKR